MFKLYKKELPEELRQELDFAIADEEMDKVIAGKSVEVELEIYKTQASSLQDEVEALKSDLASANNQIKSLEALLQSYYEKVVKL